MTTNSDDTNVANNVAQGNSQDLTKQWIYGKLKSGFYYIKDINDRVVTILYRQDHISVIKEVLAPVPSYEEWQELKEFADYSLHNRDELTRQINFWMDKHTQTEKENQQLKELLLSSRGFVDKERITLETSGFGHNEYCRRTKELLTDIDNVIGEKKC